MWAAITAIVGLITTLIAYFINPNRRRTEELNRIFKELDSLYKERDEALAKNDSDALTIISARIVQLRKRQSDIL